MDKVVEVAGVLSSTTCLATAKRPKSAQIARLAVVAVVAAAHKAQVDAAVKATTRSAW